MTNWKNSPLTVYHGTDSYALSGHNLVLLQQLSGFQVDLNKCSPLTDFGRGFYVTTSIFQARNWANDRVRKRQSTRNSLAVLLSFELDRNWLSGLESLSFLLPDSDYWDIVSYSRRGNTPHNRNVVTPQSNEQYDVIYAPVSLWPQNLIISNADQISFHSQNICNQIPSPTVLEIGTNEQTIFERTYK